MVDCTSEEVLHSYSPYMTQLTPYMTSSYHDMLTSDIPMCNIQMYDIQYYENHYNDHNEEKIRKHKRKLCITVIIAFFVALFVCIILGLISYSTFQSVSDFCKFRQLPNNPFNC